MNAEPYQVWLDIKDTRNATAGQNVNSVIIQRNRFGIGSGQTSSQYGAILDANRHLVLAAFSLQVGTLVLLVVVKIHLYQNAIKHRDCWHCGSPFPFGPTCHSTVFPGLPAESDGAAVSAAGASRNHCTRRPGKASLRAGRARTVTGHGRFFQPKTRIHVICHVLSP
ncbi:MAG: hypothetical protein WC789_04765 [Lentisphaeria bacterium]